MGRALYVFGDSIAYGKDDRIAGEWAGRLRLELLVMAIGINDAKIRAMCESRALPSLALRSELGPEHLSDGVHPGSAGHELLFRRILGFLDAAGFLD